MKAIPITLLAFFSVSVFAVAADDDKKKEPSPRVENKLDFLDKNRDGSLSEVEFAKSPMFEKVADERGPEEAKRLFTRLDKNKDGKLSGKELAFLKTPARGKPGAGKNAARKAGGKKK